MGPTTGIHHPVLLRESLEWLRPRPGAVVVDATLGPGGHAQSVLEAVGGGRVVGIDRDPAAVALARRRLGRFGDRLLAVRGDFRELVDLLRDQGIFSVDGVLADLGISSAQLDDPSRGFSFRVDGPLDMRMDPASGPTAAELIATLAEPELRAVLRGYGEERKAGVIARAIVRERGRRPIDSTRHLARVVEAAVGAGARRFRIHPATRTFQAIRIAVNRELDGLEDFVAAAVSVLRPGGRIVVIAFHSLEDRAIKRAFRSLANRCTCPPKLPVCACGRENLLRVLTPRPVRPSPEEARDNPRSRSARLRAAERV